VIGRTELCLLLRQVENAEALHNLIRHGLVRPILDGDNVIALTTTPEGDCALRAVTLPTTAE
jgi:hypothetical protein